MVVRSSLEITQSLNDNAELNKSLRKEFLKIYRWGWTATLARSNKDIKLELPKVWEPLDRLKPSQDCDRTSSHSLFSYGDKTGQGWV